MTDKAYEKRYGTDSVGITDSDNYTVAIKKSHLGLPVLRHELGHTFYNSCCITSANLSADDVEEIFCEILAHHITDIERLANECLSHFNDL